VHIVTNIQILQKMGNCLCNWVTVWVLEGSSALVNPLKPSGVHISHLS
jgi:hypothetical protein